MHSINNQGYIFWPFWDVFMCKVKNREEIEGSLEKRKGKEEKRVIKHTLKYLYEA